tara:strand:- start:143 stop:415 length:273 start_codon:yes stop_codon:yes gene_type:complete
MPLIKGFESTNIWNAFILNSLASTLVIFIAMAVKERYDNYTDKKNREINRTTNFKSIGMTIVATFIASMLAYTLMYVIFGYGGGMLVGAV